MCGVYTHLTLIFMSIYPCVGIVVAFIRLCQRWHNVLIVPRPPCYALAHLRSCRWCFALIIQIYCAQLQWSSLSIGGGDQITESAQ